MFIGHLNWWTKCSTLQRLYPLLTSGDGNCLLHAASLGIWGVHDRWLNLRQDVYHTLSSSVPEKTLKRRWLWYEWQKNLQEGLLLNADEWESEWKGVLNMADAKPRSPRQPLSTVPEGSMIKDTETSIPLTRTKSNSWQPHYESLEEIHICSLAHVLRRPIIVVADNWVYDFQGKPMSPIPFAGVYLPVECEPSECCRIPLVLAYSSSHFSPVVSTESSIDGPQSNNASSPDDQTVNDTAGKYLWLYNLEKMYLKYHDAFSFHIGNKPSADSNGDSSDKVSKSPKVEESTTSMIQAAMSSIYHVTRSTILQAAKSFSESSVQTPLPPKAPIYTAIPLVDKDLKILPLPFAADPGPNWDWMNNENSEEIVKKKSLTDEDRMSLLEKYLDVVEIDINEESMFDENKKVLSPNNISDEASNNPGKTSRFPVAILPRDNQPSFYKEVTTGYLEKAKERFDFEKETRIAEPEQPASLKCANDGCDLYGTVENNYLCTKCYQQQTKSIVKFNPPPYHPPSYSEAVDSNNVFYPPSFEGPKKENTKTLKEMSIECRVPGCTFYGTPDKNGLCSKCFGENKK
jgi:OTU domain-containing protein 7